MRALLERNPEYQKVTIVRVDWDLYRDDLIAAELNIPRQATLVVFNEGREVARVVAETGSDEIEALFKAVL